MSDDRHSYALEWRGIEPGNECRRCTGSGVLTYGSTSTWSGGAGGQVLTQGVCDACWGSGDASRKWVNLRSLREQTRAAQARNGVRDLCSFVSKSRASRSAVEAVAAVLEGFSEGRFASRVLHARGAGVAAGELAVALAKVLRAGAEAAGDDEVKP